MSAGKGDSPRKVNGDKYRENFDRIFRSRERVTELDGHYGHYRITLADTEDPIWDGPSRKEPPMQVNTEGDE